VVLPWNSSRHNDLSLQLMDACGRVRAPCASPHHLSVWYHCCSTHSSVNDAVAALLLMCAPLPQQQPRCGEAAVKLLNCFAAKELDSCSTELAAFRCAPCAPLCRPAVPACKMGCVGKLLSIQPRECMLPYGTPPLAPMRSIIISPRRVCRACASKSKLKEFMLLEECPAPPAAAKSLAAKSKVASAPPAPSASPSPQ